MYVTAKAGRRLAAMIPEPEDLPEEIICGAASAGDRDRPADRLFQKQGKSVCQAFFSQDLCPNFEESSE